MDPHMRLLKRLLLFAMEAVVLVFGIAFTVAIAAYLNSTYVFVTGLAVTVSCLASHSKENPEI
jgi:hypothetical protein